MGGETCPGGGGCVNLIRTRAGVTERDMDAARRQRLNVFGRTGVLRRERDHTDEIAGSSLPAHELSDIWRTYMLAGMRAAWAVLGRDVRAFHMHAGDHVHEQRICPARGCDDAKVTDNLFFGGGDERGNKRGDTGGKHASREALDGFDR